MKRKVGGCSTTHSPERRFYHCRWPSILTPPSGCGHLYLYLVSVENQFCEDCVLSQFIHSAFLVREREMQMKLSCCYEREREREKCSLKIAQQSSYMRKGLGIFLENREKPAATRDRTGASNFSCQCSTT